MSQHSSLMRVTAASYSITKKKKKSLFQTQIMFLEFEQYNTLL